MAEPSSPVTQLLRDDIVSGRFAPGERLVELQLTGRYGAGRAAVRSALVELAGEDLVERTPNRGAVVRRVSIEEAVEITEARSALEGLLAHKAAERATPDDREELQAIVVTMRAAVVEDDQRRYSDLDDRLHRRIHEISGQAVAVDLVTALRNRAVQHHYRIAVMPGRSEVSLAEHEALVRALVAGDGSGADKIMRAHMESVASTLRRWADLGVRP